MYLEQISAAHTHPHLLSTVAPVTAPALKRRRVRFTRYCGDQGFTKEVIPPAVSETSESISLSGRLGIREGCRGSMFIGVLTRHTSSASRQTSNSYNCSPYLHHTLIMYRYSKRYCCHSRRFRSSLPTTEDPRQRSTSVAIAPAYEIG